MNDARLLAASMFLLFSCGPMAMMPLPDAGNALPAFDAGQHVGFDAGTQAPRPPAPSFSCLQVLQCIVDCAEAEACQNECLAKGTDVAQEQTVALANCLELYSCADADCATTNCGDEVTTCLGASVPPTTGSVPLPPTPPPGSVPADLVGVWSGARNGQTEKLTFNADGTGSWWSSTTSTYYACSNITRTVRNGSFVVDPMWLTLYATQVETQVHNCTGPDEITPREALTTKIQYLRTNNPNEILFVDETCAQQFPEGRDCTMYAGCPIGLYCTARLTRQ